MWGDIVGDCTRDGACVQSANYRVNHSTNQQCVIEIVEALAAPIAVDSLQTENLFDKL